MSRGKIGNYDSGMDVISKFRTSLTASGFFSPLFRNISGDSIHAAQEKSCVRADEVSGYAMRVQADDGWQLIPPWWERRSPPHQECASPPAGLHAHGCDVADPVAGHEVPF